VAVESLPEARRQEIKAFSFDLLLALHDDVAKYSEALDDDVGLTERVEKLLLYNAGKASMNLRSERLFRPRSARLIRRSSRRTRRTLTIMPVVFTVRCVRRHRQRHCDRWRQSGFFSRHA
jgi:hypothetical protein